MVMKKILQCRYIDPLIYGDYPPEMRQMVGSRLPVFTPEERRKLKNSLDFIGINQYTTLYIKDCTLSPCNSVESSLGDALVFQSGERDGIPIGDPVRERKRERVIIWVLAHAIFLFKLFVLTLTYI